MKRQAFGDERMNDQLELFPSLQALSQRMCVEQLLPALAAQHLFSASPRLLACPAR